MIAVEAVIRVSLGDVLCDFSLDFGAFAVAELKHTHEFYRCMARTTFTA